MTDDFTVVSEVPEHANGGRKVAMARLVVAGLGRRSPSSSEGASPKRNLKKTSTISNASQQLVEAFDDATVSDYIDQIKETQA